MVENIVIKNSEQEIKIGKIGKNRQKRLIRFKANEKAMRKGMPKRFKSILAWI